MQLIQNVDGKIGRYGVDIIIILQCIDKGFPLKIFFVVVIYLQCSCSFELKTRFLIIECTEFDQFGENVDAIIEVYADLNHDVVIDRNNKILEVHGGESIFFMFVNICEVEIYSIFAKRKKEKLKFGLLLT